MMEPKAVAATIDHTILKPEACESDVSRLCAEAVEYGFASVCINGRFVRYAVEATGARVPVCAVAGFPLGAMKREIIAIEATSLVKDGATEVDFVAHLPSLMDEELEAVRADFLTVTTAVRAVLPEVVVKVILETAALSAGVSEDQAEARIRIGCLAARESGCDFVKTSTGFHPAGGASLQAVRWLRAHAGPLKVKASGGIRTAADAQAYLDAGADRLGCSAGVAIMAQLMGSVGG